MKDDEALAVGDIVQIAPEHDARFGCCLMVVSELKKWGVEGYVSIPHKNGSRQAYYRCPFEEMELVGHAEWVISHAVNGGEDNP